MYGCESRTIEKAERWKIDAFELCCCRRLLRVPWTARKSNQSILKEISPGCSLVGLMLKLKLQYFGHLMRRADSFEKILMLGKIEGRRRRGWQDEMVGWHHWLNEHGFGWTPGVGDGRGGLACCGSWGRKESGTTEWMNWTYCWYCSNLGQSSGCNNRKKEVVLKIGNKELEVIVTGRLSSIINYRFIETITQRNLTRNSEKI